MQLPFHNTRVKHWNPGASMPLVLPVHLICNTSDEEIYSNIRVNSSMRGNWVKCSDAHDGIAVLCGSGPSLAESIEAVASMKASGAIVYAMNGAAKFLADKGIMPDYQVIIDARIETAELVGPAINHLFASQVHPETFDRAPDAQLWHLQIGNIENEFPDYEDSYVLIGGAASVGNTATCLAYAMGFRELHCFGYDSSHRDGKGHAFSQPLNDGDPCAIVEFDGKEYTASLTMKLQAERFFETAKALEEAGCKIEVHGDGLLPDIFNKRHLMLPDDLEAAEKAKYEAMWNIKGYRNYAPGEHHVMAAIEHLKMQKGDSVLDFGCGTGRGAAKFMELGFDITGIDLADNSLDSGLLVPVIHACLWDLPDVTAKHGYCTDVMEHIPTEKVDAVLANIAARVGSCYFNISTQPDAMGVLIGQSLHLTVQNASWWREKLLKQWRDVTIEDMGGEIVAICN